MLLKALTVVLGVMIVVSRGSCVISPAFSRRLMKGLIDRKLVALVMGPVLAVYGASMFWSVRVAVYGEGADLSPAKGFWGFLLGAWMAIGGLTLLAAPGLFTRMLNYFLGRSDTVLRVIMTIGVVVGLAVLWLGIWVY